MFEKIYLIENIIKTNKIEIEESLIKSYFGDYNEVFDIFIDVYLKTYKNLHQEILDLTCSKNYFELEKLFHKLKGSSVYLGVSCYSDFISYLYNELININNSKTSINIEDELILASSVSSIINNYYLEFKK